jgi:hypothetical protein
VSLSQSLNDLLSQPLWLRLIVAALATWRLSSLLVNKNEAGPANLLHRIRDWAGAYELGEDDEPITSLGKLFSCVWCMSVWVGAALAVIAITPCWALLIPFALSAVAILINARVVDG